MKKVGDPKPVGGFFRNDPVGKVILRTIVA